MNKLKLMKSLIKSKIFFGDFINGLSTFGKIISGILGLILLFFVIAYIILPIFNLIKNI